MTDWRVPLHASTLGDAEEDAVVEVLRSGRVTMGDRVAAFEEAFAKYTGHKFAVMVNSGSSANLLAVSALMSHKEIMVDDEVVVPALCWSTTVWPLIQHGIVPVVVDIDPLTWGIGESVLGRHSVGCAPVHVYGNPARYASSMGRILFEDCCEAFGARQAGRHVGHHGRLATFSLYYSHHINTIEGGVVCTDDPNLDETLRIQRAHGWIRDLAPETQKAYARLYLDIDPKFLFVDVGYNLRPTEIDAAIGLAQLGRLGEIISARNHNWNELHARLSEIRTFEFQRATDGCEPAWFGFNMVVGEQAPITRDQLRKALETKGIETRPVIAGNIARQPGFKKSPHRVVSALPVADRIMDRALSIGCHQGVTPKDIDYVCSVIEEALT